MAVVPLWQLAQVPCTWVWSTRAAGANALVAWQFSHSWVVAMCAAFWPVAIVPLWQVTQLPVIPPWSKRLAGSQAVVAWQFWHSAGLGMWLPGLPVAAFPHRTSVPARRQTSTGYAR